MKNMKKTMLFFVLLLTMVFGLTMTVSAASTVKINKKKTSLYVEQTETLKITGTKKKVTWTSTKPKIAKVSQNGKVTALKKGTATIKAKVGGKTYSCTVTVKNDYFKEKGIKITKKAVGKSFKSDAKTKKDKDATVTFKIKSIKTSKLSGFSNYEKTVMTGTCKVSKTGTIWAISVFDKYTGTDFESSIKVTGTKKSPHGKDMPVTVFYVNGKKMDCSIRMEQKGENFTYTVIHPKGYDGIVFRSGGWSNEIMEKAYGGILYTEKAVKPLQYKLCIDPYYFSK